MAPGLRCQNHFSMIEHIFLFLDTHCGIFNSTVSVSTRP